MRTDGRRDGRTDMTKLIDACRNVAKAPKIKVVHRKENREHINALWGKCAVLLYKPGRRQRSPYGKTLCALSSGRPNFVRLCPIFVGLLYRNYFMSPF
jgi:hypothetical protein